MNYNQNVISTESLIKEATAFRPKKHLGQHFLVDVDTLQTIVDSLEARPDDLVIEVGSGIGFLTRLLVETGAQVVAVDLDRQATRMLADMDLPKVQIKHGDFLGFDLNAMDFFPRQRQQAELEQLTLEDDLDLLEVEHLTPPSKAESDAALSAKSRRLKIIGNVPYQITGRIIGHILGEIDKPSPWLNRIDSVVLTIQHEVAKRFVASAGEEDYSKASLLIGYFCQASIISVVPPDAFYPAPAVTSAVIQLIPRKQPAVQCRDTRLLKKVIEAGFRQRRKMLKNSLSFMRFTPAEIDQVFRKLCFDPQVRAERLSLQQFAMLADALDELPKTDANNPSNITSQTESDI